MNNTMMKSMSKYNNGTKSDARPKRNHGLKNTTMKSAIRKSMLKDINNKTKVEARQKNELKVKIMKNKMMKSMSKYNSGIKAEIRQ